MKKEKITMVLNEADRENDSKAKKVLDMLAKHIGFKKAKIIVLHDLNVAYLCFNIKNETSGVGWVGYSSRYNTLKCFHEISLPLPVNDKHLAKHFLRKMLEIAKEHDIKAYSKDMPIIMKKGTTYEELLIMLDLEEVTAMQEREG